VGSWNEVEIRDAIRHYFELLKAEELGKPLNKSEIYRNLNLLHPNRSAKAFERKFQNISAVLYENRLPYCSGLKPLFHYQRLLRLLILDQLDRTPLPAVEPHEILQRRLSELKKKGSIPVKKAGTGRYGLAVEDALGISANSSKSPDFMGIELKTKSDRTMQTLFSRTPSRYTGVVNKTALFEQYSYSDKDKRRRLSTSFGSAGDQRGFSLHAAERRIIIRNAKLELFEFDAERIEEALLSKHSQSVYLQVDGKQDSCSIQSARYCQWPSVIRFLKLVEEGSINLDLTMSQKGAAIRDHGFLWRIYGRDIDRLYLKAEELYIGA